MQNLYTELHSALWRYFPDSNEEHIDYVTKNLTAAIRSYTAMKVSQHQCGCEWHDGTEFCKGFNSAIRMASGILEQQD